MAIERERSVSAPNSGLSFWATVPGVLAALFGVLIAMAGLARVLLEFGFLYPKESPSQPQKASVAKPLPTSADPVSRALSKLPLGSAAVAAPKSVRQYDDFEVTLRLAKEPLAENIDAAKGESPAGYVMQGVPDVRISPRMRAELYGKDFLIDAAAATEQAVTLSSDTKWKWRVRGEWPGNRSLFVSLHTIVKVGGNESPRIVEVAAIELAVTVAPAEWALRNWQWIVTALVLPPFGWLPLRILNWRK